LASGTDLCGSVSLDSNSYDKNNFEGGCGATGGQFVTFYLSDDCNNVAVCVASVAIVDNTPPTVICQDTLVVECTAQIPVQTPGITDNCAVGGFTFSDDVTDVECEEITGTINQVVQIIRRTFVASDQCENTASCTQMIYVVDQTAPIVTCPPSVTVECGAPIDTSDLGVPTAIDECSDSLFLELLGDQILIEEPCTTVILRAFRVTDACGNGTTGGQCPQFITIVDTEPPVLTIPADKTIECGDELPADDATAVDVCDTNAIVTSVVGDTIGMGCERYLVKTYTATDACGNTATGTQRIMILDTEPPVIDCPPTQQQVQCGTPLPTDVPLQRMCVTAM
jgi:hypothetical protein